MSDITMYGTPTCKDCVIAKRVFDELGTEYQFRNMVEDQEATEIAIELNNGIKCKNTPALLAPMIETPLFQKIKEKIPANIATYDSTDIYDGNPSPVESITFSGSGKAIAFTYVTDDTNDSHSIQGFTITYGLGDVR